VLRTSGRHLLVIVQQDLSQRVGRHRLRSTLPASTAFRGRAPTSCDSQQRRATPAHGTRQLRVERTTSLPIFAFGIRLQGRSALACRGTVARLLDQRQQDGTLRACLTSPKICTYSGLAAVRLLVADDFSASGSPSRRPGRRPGRRNRATRAITWTRSSAGRSASVPGTPTRTRPSAA